MTVYTLLSPSRTALKNIVPFQRSSSSRLSVESEEMMQTEIYDCSCKLHWESERERGRWAKPCLRGIKTFQETLSFSEAALLLWRWENLAPDGDLVRSWFIICRERDGVFFFFWSQNSTTDVALRFPDLSSQTREESANCPKTCHSRTLVDL